MPLVQVFGGPYALNSIFDEQCGMVIDIDRLEAVRNGLGKYLLQVSLFAELLVPFVFGGFASFADNSPVLTDLGTVGPSLIVVEYPFDPFVKFEHETSPFFVLHHKYSTAKPLSNFTAVWPRGMDWSILMHQNSQPAAITNVI